MKLTYKMKGQTIGPLVFSNKKILKKWIAVIKERGATDVKVDM